MRYFDESYGLKCGAGQHHGTNIPRLWSASVDRERCVYREPGTHAAPQRSTPDANRMDILYCADDGNPSSDIRSNYPALLSLRLQQ